MKKKLALILTAAMLAGTLAGCGGGDSTAGGGNAGGSAAGGGSAAAGTESGDGGGAAGATDVDPRFKYEEPVTLTSFFEISPTIMGEFKEEDAVSSLYYERMKEETNITVDWKWYAAMTDDDSVQKKSVAIASGDIPDFMIVNSAQLSLLAKSDLINRDIGEIFNAYASDELMAWTTGEGNAALESASDKGQVIAIPLVDSSIDGASMMWIRRDWIEKLGLEMPETMDELYDVMVAFRDQDPDGNGKNDTIGMVFNNNFPNASFGDGVGLFNGFGAYPRAWIEDGNGGLMYGAVAEENKAALDYLAKLYQEGLIEQDFSSNDESKASEAAVSGRAGVQYGLMWNGNFPLNSTIQNDPEADWVSLPLPSATGEPARPQSSLDISGYVVVNKNCEHPEAVVRMLNFWVDIVANTNGTYNDYLVEDANGALMFPLHWVMLKTFYSSKNLDIHNSIVEALETGDDSKVSTEGRVSYEDCLKYIDGDRVGGFSGMKTFGNDMSAFDVIGYYYENDLILLNGFVTAPTPTMG